jgi:hypothetical protein
MDWNLWVTIGVCVMVHPRLGHDPRIRRRVRQFTPLRTGVKRACGVRRSDDDAWMAT